MVEIKNLSPNSGGSGNALNRSPAAKRAGRRRGSSPRTASASAKNPRKNRRMRTSKSLPKVGSRSWRNLFIGGALCWGASNTQGVDAWSLWTKKIEEAAQVNVKPNAPMNVNSNVTEVLVELSESMYTSAMATAENMDSADLSAPENIPALVRALDVSTSRSDAIQKAVEDALCKVPKYENANYLNSLTQSKCEEQVALFQGMANQGGNNGQLALQSAVKSAVGCSNLGFRMSTNANHKTWQCESQKQKRRNIQLMTAEADQLKEAEENRILEKVRDERLRAGKKLINQELNARRAEEKLAAGKQNVEQSRENRKVNVNARNVARYGKKMAQTREKAAANIENDVERARAASTARTNRANINASEVARKAAAAGKKGIFGRLGAYAGGAGGGALGEGVRAFAVQSGLSKAFDSLIGKIIAAVVGFLTLYTTGILAPFRVISRWMAASMKAIARGLGIAGARIGVAIASGSAGARTSTTAAMGFLFRSIWNTLGAPIRKIGNIRRTRGQVQVQDPESTRPVYRFNSRAVAGVQNAINGAEMERLGLPTGFGTRRRR